MMLQAEFNQFYDKVKRHAWLYAGSYFKDYAMREQAVDTAMDYLTDCIVKRDVIPTVPVANGIVRHLIKQSLEESAIKPTGQRFKGNKVYQAINDIKPLKVRVEQIRGKTEQAIMRLYVQGLTQDEIEQKLGVKQPNISTAISKWTK